MVNVFDGVIDRFVVSSAEFGQRLRLVGPEQWGLPTPCTQWNVRQLANHVTRGNLNYVALLAGATSAEFLRTRDLDALGTDPLDAYGRSTRACVDAFSQPTALHRVLDYPLGKITGRQALAVRTTDTTIHAWDLARAIGANDTLNADLISWIHEHLDEIYAGLAETPIAVDTTHRFFAAPKGVLTPNAAKQDQLLHRMGRGPDVTEAATPTR